MSRYHQGKFRPQNPHKYVGDVENIIYRSRWEFVLFKTLDEHPDILEWASEELYIPYVSPVDNRWHRYYPDVYIKQKNKHGQVEKVLIEVKPYAETQKPQKGKRRKTTKRLMYESLTYAKNQAKWLYAERFCKKHGMRFEIITEKELFGDKK